MNKSNNISASTTKKGGLGEQLAALTGRKQPRVQHNNRGHRQEFRVDELPALNTIGVDGVDHININAMSSDELGKHLGLTNSSLRVHVPKLGSFSCIYNLWFWLLDDAHNDQFREASFNTNKMLGERMKRFGPLRNFKNIILEAAYQRIANAAPLRDAVVESTLPFDIYYIKKDMPSQRPKYAGWVVHGHEEIRRALKEGREPNFDRWLDPVEGESESIYAHILELISDCPSAIKGIQESVEAQAEVSPEPEEAAA